MYWCRRLFSGYLLHKETAKDYIYRYINYQFSPDFAPSLDSEFIYAISILVVLHNCLAILLWPISFTLPSGLRAAGDVRFTMFISIGSVFIFRISFAYILGVVFHLGVIGIWLAMGIDWTVRSIIYIVRFKSGRWKNFKVI